MTNMIKTLWKTITSTNTYRQTARELNRLTDRELSDIGISRCDIHKIASDSMTRA